MAYGHQMKITTTNVRPTTTEVTKTTNIQTISKEIEATTMSIPYDTYHNDDFVANQNDNFDYFAYEEPIPIIPIVNLGPRTVINQESNQEWWKA